MALPLRDVEDIQDHPLVDMGQPRLNKAELRPVHDGGAVPGLEGAGIRVVPLLLQGSRVLVELEVAENGVDKGSEDSAVTNKHILPGRMADRTCGGVEHPHRLRLLRRLHLELLGQRGEGGELDTVSFAVAPELAPAHRRRSRLEPRVARVPGGHDGPDRLPHHHGPEQPLCPPLTALVPAHDPVQDVKGRRHVGVRTWVPGLPVVERRRHSV